MQRTGRKIAMMISVDETKKNPRFKEKSYSICQKSAAEKKYQCNINAAVT